MEHHCYPPPIAVQLPGREKQSPHKCGNQLAWCAWRGVMSQRLMQLSMLRSMCGPCTRSATWKCGSVEGGEGGAQHVWAVSATGNWGGREGGGRPPISVGLSQLGSHAPAGHVCCKCVDGPHQSVGVICGSPSPWRPGTHTSAAGSAGPHPVPKGERIYRDGGEGEGGRSKASNRVHIL